MLGGNGRSWWPDLNRFAADTSGATAVIFGIALIPLAFVAGGSIDYSRASSTRTSLQKALDAAVLAGAIEAAKGTSASAIPNVINNYFQTNSNLSGGIKLDTQIDTTAGTIAATGQYALDMAFMKLAGINSLDIGATSVASYSVGLSEVALALDTTGSMSGEKIEAAQKAANDLVDSLFAMPNAAQNLRVSLVPFTYYVNVGLQYRDASWISGATDTSTTTQQCWNDVSKRAIQRSL